MSPGVLIVTGAFGFVGSHLVERARERGTEVLTADLDLREAGAVRELFEDVRPGAVIHLASTREGSPWKSLAENLLITGNVLEAASAAANRIPVLIPGSAAQYGMGASAPLRETDETDPVSAYGVAKCALEVACTSRTLHDARVIWTRSFNHLGPAQGSDAPVASWARQAAQAERAGSGAIHTGSLEPVRDFLDVRDVANAYLDLIQSPAEGVINVCSGEAVRLADVVEKIASMSSCELRIEHDADLDRAVDPPVIVGDNGLLRSLTGWQRRISLEQSLTDVLDEWRGRVAAPQQAAGTRGG